MHDQSSKPIRVLKTVQSYFPFQDRGGPVVKVRALARGLTKRGHHVTVVTADLGIRNQNGAGIRVDPCRWGWRAEEEGVEAIYLSTLFHYRALTLNLPVLRFSFVSLRRFDLVHVYGLYDLLGPIVTAFCRRWAIPYVVEPMGMFRPIIRSLWLKNRYHQLLGGRMIHGARHLIVTSEQERQELLDHGLEDWRVVVRRNGIDLPSRLPARGDFRRRFGISPKTKLILFLGRIISKKSPELLIEAFAQWRRMASHDGDSKLILAGPDEGDGFSVELKKKVDRLLLNPHVVFTGPLYDDAKWSAYLDADVFVLPSQNENFGNTAGESVGCGTPVIVTDRCGIAPIVEGRAGLVIPHSVAALGRALELLLSNPKLREAFQEGCATVTRELSWDKPVAEMERLYAQCKGGVPSE